ncbi:MAG: response regulator transcription factor [Flavobacteriales bacterium]|nr:response regulator transcription factor [Flavobacteriales bacterium]
MNCIVIEDSEIQRKLICHYIEKTDYLNLKRDFVDAVEAVSYLRKETVDLIFLDISMPVMSGMEFLKSFDNSAQVILFTSHEEYALEAFEYNVIDYLVKPVSYARFMKAVNKAKAGFEKGDHETSDEIFIKVNSVFEKVRISEILWIEALADYVIINTSERKYTVLSSMKSIVSKLPTKEFMRVHRSSIIRIDKISKIDNGVIEIVGKKLITIGRSYKKEVMDRLVTI